MSNSPNFLWYYYVLQRMIGYCIDENCKFYSDKKYGVLSAKSPEK